MLSQSSSTKMIRSAVLNRSRPKDSIRVDIVAPPPRSSPCALHLREARHATCHQSNRNGAPRTSTDQSSDAFWAGSRGMSKIGGIGGLRRAKLSSTHPTRDLARHPLKRNGSRFLPPGGRGERGGRA